jgi:hypothetical protein
VYARRDQQWTEASLAHGSLYICTILHHYHCCRCRSVEAVGNIVFVDNVGGVVKNYIVDLVDIADDVVGGVDYNCRAGSEDENRYGGERGISLASYKDLPSS